MNDALSPWNRFRANRPAVAALFLLTSLFVACFASLPWSSSQTRQSRLTAARQPPSAAHWLGTDELGRDLLARTLYGGAISLSLGLLASAVAVVFGAAYGLVAGYVGGRYDALMMRFVDVLYSMPSVLLVMLLTVSLGAQMRESQILSAEWSRFVVLALAIGGISWLTTARVVRGQVLLIREQPFIEAARALGLPTPRILLRHVLPNCSGPLIVFGTLTFPQAVLQESFLSFLGVGVQPPHATWGSLAADGVRMITPAMTDWWLILFPCLILSVTLLSLNFLADGLRDALDPRDAPNSDRL